MKKNIKLISIIATLILVSIIGFIEIGMFKDYGWTLFSIIPFFTGFLPPFISGRINAISRNDSFKLSFLTLGIVLISLLVFAIEGII